MQMPAAWTERDTVERRSNLSLEEFIEEYEKPSKPVIITDVVTNWEAYKSWNKVCVCVCVCVYDEENMKMSVYVCVCVCV